MLGFSTLLALVERSNNLVLYCEMDPSVLEEEACRVAFFPFA